MPPEADPVRPERLANEICVYAEREYIQICPRRESQKQFVCMDKEVGPCRVWCSMCIMPCLMFLHGLAKQLSKLFEVEGVDVGRIRVMVLQTHCEPFPFLCARRCPTSHDRLLAASAHQACTRYTAHA